MTKRMSVLSCNTLPAFAGGVFAVGRADNALPTSGALRRGWQSVVSATGMLVLTMLLLLCSTGGARAALILSQPDALLSWDTAAIPARANVQVLRFERIGFFAIDPLAGQNFFVRPGNFADQDSLSGTPSVLAPLPDPLDDNGAPIALNNLLPLAPSTSFTSQQPIFIVAEGPILPAGGITTRPDGRRIMAVTVDISGAASQTLTLVETQIGSADFVGYLQPNSAGSPIIIPPGANVTLRYDNNGDVADSQAVNPPFLADPGFVAGVLAERTLIADGTPLPGSDLFVSKQALRSTVAQGDFLAYDVRVENTGGAPLLNVAVRDQLPVGLRYQAGSLRLDNAASADPQLSANGRELLINLGNLGAGQSVMLRYVVEVTTATPTGRSINQVQAISGTMTSNLASAAVLVENPFFNDRAFLMGRVIIGQCGEDDAPGLANVRLYMEDGTSVITDAEGRWHIEGVRPGTHVLQLDTVTLGPRHSLRQCHDNTRQAGNPRSRFVNVQGGTLWRENWYIEEHPGIGANLQQQLLTRVEDGKAIIELPIGNGELAFDEIVTHVFLPDALTPVSGSATLDGEPISDPLKIENFYEFRFQPRGHFWQHRLALELALDPSVTETVEKSIMANTFGSASGGGRHSVSSINRVRVKGAPMSDEALVLRPRFSSLSAALSDADREQIRQTAEQLRDKPNLRLEVTGHSDNQKIRYNPNRQINDNYALSEFRAAAVADYLAEVLEIERSRIRVIGKGADQPIADNRSAEGRALNRRVEVRFSISERVGDANFVVVQGDSGLSRDRASDARAEQPAQQAGNGFVNLKDGQVTPWSVVSVTALLDQRLKPALLLDGKPVPDDRIGMKIVDEESGLIRYTWVGVELDQVGDHRLQLSGLDPFGNARFKEEITLRRSSRIKTIRVQSVPENVADGRTPVQVKLQLLDEFEQPINAQLELQLVSGDLQPLNQNQRDDLLLQRGQNVIIDNNGIARFEPVGTAGSYRIRLTDGNIVSDELVIPVAPDLREWILVGFAEGSIGYNTLRDNASAVGNPEDDVYTDGEVSFFARGQIKGEWLLTAAYDSRRKLDDQPAGQAIDPQRYYSLYGDDTLRGHDAASREKLYVRMEKRDFYALFGDFDTGLTVTELSRYQRVLTGLKSAWQGRNASVEGFAAETEYGFVRDDIPGDGTSGLYRLSRGDIIPASEEIRIEVRDRFTNEVLSSTSMTRFIDYSIDNSDGTFYFRMPVPVQDENFNPVRIVATYEVEQGSEEVVGGGRATVHDADKKIVLGITGVDDNGSANDGSLLGADLTWQPNQHHTVKAEIAGTRQQQPASSNDQAWLAEHRYTSEKLDTRVRIEETDGGFGLGQVAADDQDSRLIQGSARYRINESLALSTDISRQEVPSTDNQRDIVEGRVEYAKDVWRAHGGVRYSEDQTATGDFQSKQLVAGASRDFLEQRLTLSATGETSIDSSEENTDLPKRLAFGSEYRLNPKVSLFANQDFTWSQQRRTQESRVGARATPWQGGTVTTDVNRRMDEFGPRLQAHAGLFQTIDLTPQWSMDFGFDRAQTLTDSAVVNETFDPRRPAANGSFDDDYTALSVGAGYRTAEWQWTNRAEYRIADAGDKWNLLSGFSHRVNDADTLAGRVLHFDEKFRSGDENSSTELDVSYARRPLSASWFWLNRSRLIYDEQRNSLGSLFGYRAINNSHFNFVHQTRHQLSLQYSFRYIGESIDGDSFNGFSDLIGAEYRYDITRRWDIGVRGSTLASYNSNIRTNTAGVMVGFSPIQDIWLSLGYNFIGFYDEDFDGAEGRVQGVVLDFRIKFDQHSAKKLLGSRGEQ